MRKNAFSAMLLLVLSMVWNVQPVSAQSYQPDEDTPLITNVVADPEETQLTSNCTWNITPDNDNYSFNKEYIDAGNLLGALIDNDVTTYWHSDPTGPNLHSQDLYIQVDLKRTDIQRFFYRYDRRGDVYNGAVRRGTTWTKIEIKATNTPDDNTSWVTVAIHDNLPSEGSNDDRWPCTPPMVDMQQPYRYLRFYARDCSTIYWSFSEFQMYPVREVTDPRELLIELLDSTDPGAFTVGTDPGCYGEEQVKTFEAEWTKANNLTNNASATDAELQASLESLRKALDEAKASRLPVTDGYYRFVCSSDAFMSIQGVEKAIYANTDENRLAWKTLDEADPTQVFKVTQLPGGNYSIQCVGNHKYMDWVAGDACLSSDAYNLTLAEKQSTAQIIFPDEEHNRPWFALYNEKNKNTYHCVYHSNGNGESGYMVPANVGYDAFNYFYMRRVDEATAEALEKKGMSEVYAKLLSDAVQTAKTARAKTNDYEALIYEANDEDDDHNQFSSNARWTYKDAASGGQGAYANLIDGSSETYFHSDAVHAVSGYHYLQVDLKRTDISEFIFKMLRRGDGQWRNNWNQMPIDVEIWATNDASAVNDETPVTEDDIAASAWKKITRLNSGFPDVSSHDYYTSPIVKMGDKYQYIRFVVLKTHNNAAYFNMSEFQVYNTVPTESSEYYTVHGMKEVCDQLDVEIENAQKKIDDLTATPDDTATINQLVRQLNALYVDRAGINKTLSSALTIASSAYKASFSFDNLLTEAAQFYCNTPADDTNYGNLIDNNLKTYFQSKQRTSDPELNKSSTFLQIDLKRTDLSKVNFEFYGIASGWQNPNTLDIYVSNDTTDASSWKRYTSLNEGFDTKKANAHYISPDLDFGAPYQFIRLYPMGAYTADGTADYTFNMAEIQFHSTTPNQEKSQYYYVAGLKEAADNLKAIIDRVQEKVDKNMAIDLSDTAAINEATRAVKALVCDPTDYATLAADVKEMLSSTFIVGNAVGQYPTEAVETLKGVLDQANGMVNYDKPDRNAFEQATALLTAARDTFLTKQVGVNTGMWYTLRYPSEEYFQSRGWDAASWWTVENPFYSQYIAPGTRDEVSAEIISADEVAAGDSIYYFSKEDVDNAPEAAQWRFVEISKGKYALQNRLSGLFIYSETGENTTSMQLTPSAIKVQPLGYGQCALDLSTVTGSSLGTYHYLNGRGNAIANQVGTWSAVGTDQADNSLFVIEPVEAIDEASYNPSFIMHPKTADATPMCFATDIKSIEGVTAYTAAGTYEQDGVKYIALNELEGSLKAGQPFFLISDGEYDGESTEDARVYPGSTVVTKGINVNGLIGTLTKVSLSEGLIYFTHTEAKTVDNVTTSAEAGTAYMRYGQRLVDASVGYDKTIAISGKPTDFSNNDLEKHEGTKDDPYPISNANELMALKSLMHTGQMTYAILDEDIDMDGETWEPINVNNSEANGKSYMNWLDLDGRGHVVSNLTSNGYPYASVFGVLCGSVRNIGFENVNIDCTETGSGVLGGYVGHGNFTDASGNKLTTTVENVWVTGKLHVSSSYCGGLFGNIGGPTTIKNCYTNLDITSGASITGGLIGRVRDALTIENAYAAGTCTGAGIIGGGQNASTPASTYKNIVIWNGTDANFGTTAEADSKTGISSYDGTNFAALQETVVGWGRAWYCDMQDGSYPTLIDNGIRVLLDVVFNEDGTATDASPLKSKVEVLGNTPQTYWNEKFNRYVAKFDADMGTTPNGLYKVDFENNSTFSAALANGHSLEMVIKADQNITKVTKPFSAMQAGGTGFETAEVDGKHVVRFNPNVSTNGGSNWGRVDSHLAPEVGVYYHVIGVWDKQQQKAYIYVNGQLDGQVELPGSFHFPNNGSGWFGIGGDPSTNNKSTNAWNGDIVIARVYNDALTADEVTALWNDVKGGVGVDGVKASTNQKDATYTINGIRVEKTQKGIYIINGKKVMVK